MAALPAEWIIAHQGTLTGSIGVIMETLDATALSQKIGIQMYRYASGPLKGEPSPLHTPSPQTALVMQRVVEDVQGMFVRMVSQHRQLSIENVRMLADGRVFTGMQALRAGLVDAVGSTQDGLTWLATRMGGRTTLPVYDIPLDTQEYARTPRWVSYMRDLLGYAAPDMRGIWRGTRLLAHWQAQP